MILGVAGAHAIVRTVAWTPLVVAASASTRARGLVSEDANLLADVLGITPAQLLAELDGRSIAQVATDRGVSARIIVHALLSRCIGRIAARIESGQITREDGLEAFPRLAERAVNRVHRPMAAMRVG